MSKTSYERKTTLIVLQVGSKGPDKIFGLLDTVNKQLVRNRNSMCSVRVLKPLEYLPLKPLLTNKIKNSLTLQVPRLGFFLI